MGRRAIAQMRRGVTWRRRALAASGALAVVALAVGVPAASAQASSAPMDPAGRVRADPPPPPPRIDAVAAHLGVLYVRFDDRGFDQYFDPATETLHYVTMSRAERDSIATVTETCLPSDPRVCYGAVPHRLAIEESRNRGATWSTAWEVSEADREILAHNYDAVGEPGELFVSSVAVAETVDGYVVLAAAEEDGLVMRHEDGTWERIGLTKGHVPALGADPWLWRPYPVVWAFLTFCVLVIAFGEARGMRDRYAARVGLGWLLSGFGLLVAYVLARSNHVGPPTDTISPFFFLREVLGLLAVGLILAGLAAADGAAGMLYPRAVALAVVGSLVAWKAATLALDPGRSLWNAGAVTAIVVAEFATIGVFLMRLGKPRLS